MATVAGVTVDTTRWTTVFQSDKTNYMVVVREYLQEIETNENGTCKLTKLAKYHAAYMLAVLMSNHKEWGTTPADYETLFNYDEVKACLACDNINFDTILNTILP